MIKKNIDVSVLCANYNNAPYLNDFFESLLSSTVLPDEIIFIDDCSTDDSVVIVKYFQSKFHNLKLFCLSKNVGFANALNFGLNKISSNFTVRIDPDDIFHPERIERQINFLKSNPKIDILGSNITYFSRIISESIGSSNFPRNHKHIRDRYEKGYHGLVHGSIMIKTNILKDNRYNQETVPAEEYDLFSRLLKSGFLSYNLEESLTFVRIHNASASNNYPISTFEKISLLQKRYWGIEMSKYSFYRKYLMIYFYRKSLTNVLLKRYFFTLLSVILAPSLIINRIKKQFK